MTPQMTQPRDAFDVARGFLVAAAALHGMPYGWRAMLVAGLQAMHSDARLVACAPAPFACLCGCRADKLFPQQDASLMLN
jgi:hypothetical protein